MTTTSDLAPQPPEGHLPAARLDPRARAQLFDLAMVGHEQGDHEAARDILHGLVVLNRQDARAWALLGRVEFSLKQLQHACEALSRALNLSRKDWDTALDL